MKKIYYVTKEKSNIKGFWKNPANGKLYIDNIKIIYPNYEFKKEVKNLFNVGEKEVFTEENRKVTIYKSNGENYILNNKKVIKLANITKNIVKNLIANYNGFTIFKELGIYKVEIWS